jgi:hypothetical protein
MLVSTERFTEAIYLYQQLQVVQPNSASYIAGYTHALRKSAQKLALEVQSLIDVAK